MQLNNTVDFSQSKSDSIQRQARELVVQMSLHEKIGQMSQLQSGTGSIPEHLGAALREGRVGSILNEVDVDVVNELQRISVEESRLGIPLLIARDVIHGFRTIFPIPLGLAASWDPEIVELGARIGAAEAATCGVNWTFAPMIDITRDPRWGRIAESLGEDPYLCSKLGAAMVKGFQGNDLSKAGNIAACAKHFAAYGAAEGGRDYSTANVPETELRNTYLKPFHAAAEAGVATMMTAFCDVNGVPATGNQWLLNTILRDQWKFNGVVVSDWESIVEMSVHGYTRDDAESALKAVTASVDMEMASSSYKDHLPDYVNAGDVSEPHIDTIVTRILELKIRLGLFDNPYTHQEAHAPLLDKGHLRAAKQAAVKSCVLLKNDKSVLPLKKSAVESIALIGPLADDGYEQMGTWVFDGVAEDTVTCLQALNEQVGRTIDIRHVKALETTRSSSTDGFAEAIQAATDSDVSVVVVGEESFMSGEAHSRADISLPGEQEALINAVADTGTPLVVVIMAGRPLTIEHVVERADAVLYAWHPGSMGGPAITDLLFGLESPSGKLPVTFPRKVGQVPIYYSQKNTGRPATDETCVDMDSVPPRAPQTSLGMTAFHLDAGHRPLFPFGYGLSYSKFQYVKITLSHHTIQMGEQVEIFADVVNTGSYTAEEVVQLYVRDLVASVTRPVKELKGFKRIRLKPGERERISFVLQTDDLAFYNEQMQWVTEPGQFHVWIGGSSDAQLWAEFEIAEPR